MKAVLRGHILALAAVLIWGQAAELVGAVTASVCLCLIPVVSVLGAAVLLGEPVDGVIAAAIAVILAGLVFSQKGNRPAAGQ